MNTRPLSRETKDLTSRNNLCARESIDILDFLYKQQWSKMTTTNIGVDWKTLNTSPVFPK